MQLWAVFTTTSRRLICAQIFRYQINKLRTWNVSLSVIESAAEIQLRSRKLIPGNNKRGSHAVQHSVSWSRFVKTARESRKNWETHSGLRRCFPVLISESKRPIQKKNMLGNSDYAPVRTTAPTWLHANYRTGHSSVLNMKEKESARDWEATEREWWTIKRSQDAATQKHETRSTQVFSYLTTWNTIQDRLLKHESSRSKWIEAWNLK